jgi:hypothetical protein
MLGMRESRRRSVPRSPLVRYPSHREAMAIAKVQLNFLTPDPTDEEILAFFKALTGRDPTPEEIEELRAEATE